MDEAQVKFGDKIFLYGTLLRELENFDQYEYNKVIGYSISEIAGFVVDPMSASSFAVTAPFSQMEMVDVTDKLSINLPLPFGTKVWMPLPDMNL